MLNLEAVLLICYLSFALMFVHPSNFPHQWRNIFDYYQNQITFHFWLRVLEESLKFARPEDKRTPARINHLNKSYPIEQLDKIQIFSHVVLSEIYYYNPQS